MSLEIVRIQLENFIKSNTNEVMILRGEWGAGKTYIWHEILQALRNESGYDAYAKFLCLVILT